MGLIQKASTRLNLKQKSGADVPRQPARPVTYRDETTSTDNQTILSLTFAVDQNSTRNFFLILNGQVLTPGVSGDYQFINVAADNSSNTIQFNSAISGGLPIIAAWLGIAQPNVSVSTLQAQVDSNSANIPANFLLNSGFGLLQRGSSVTNIANGQSTYGPDRWYVKNSLGTNGVLRWDYVAPSLNGSFGGASVKISTAPTAAQANGCEFYQVLEYGVSALLYGQTASFSIQAKALGNVNQVGVQFFYATTEAKLTTAIGSEVLVAVNSASFSLAQIVGQALGVAQTTSGVVGVRIRITGVSSGNTWDLNNGFVVEQGMMTKSSTVANWRPAGSTVMEEIAACQRFYEKSYDLAIAPGSITNDGADVCYPTATSRTRTTSTFKVTKRVQPTLTPYSSATGATAQFRNTTTLADIAAAPITVGIRAVGTESSATVAVTDRIISQWTADAEI